MNLRHVFPTRQEGGQVYLIVTSFLATRGPLLPTRGDDFSGSGRQPPPMIPGGLARQVGRRKCWRGMALSESTPRFLVVRIRITTAGVNDEEIHTIVPMLPPRDR